MQGHLRHRCHHRRVWRRGNFLLQGVRLQRQTCHCLKQRKKSNQVTLIHIQMCSGQIPDHPAEQDTLAPNPNIRCSGWQFVQLEVTVHLFLFIPIQIFLLCSSSLAFKSSVDPSTSLSLHSHSNISSVFMFCFTENPLFSVVFSFPSQFLEVLHILTRLIRRLPTP